MVEPLIVEKNIDELVRFIPLNVEITAVEPYIVEKTEVEPIKLDKIITLFVKVENPMVDIVYIPSISVEY
jgi:hypothetical protein